MIMSNRRGLVFYFLAILISLHVLLLLGFPDALKISIGLVLVLLFFFIGSAQALLLSFSLAFFVLVFGIGIQLTGIEKGMYYRPHDLLKSRNPDFGDVYKPNAQIAMRSSFGDIQAMTNVGIFEPHEFIYKTDGLGFRNPVDYHGQRYVLVGDSFIVGIADTQSCLVTEWLRREHRLDTYNLGFPGDINDYVNRINAFRNRFGDEFRVLLFVFESNDFIPPYTGKPVSKPSLIHRYISVFKETGIWRYTKSLYLRSVKKGKNKKVEVKTIGGQPMGFYEQDLNAVRNHTALTENHMGFVTALQEIKPVVDRIFFIPAKYRVYGQWISPTPLANEQWQYLQRAAQQAGIPVHDLTPALQTEAARLLPQGQYVYWRDDTHWNCNGMRAAAAEVARVLKSR